MHAGGTWRLGRRPALDGLRGIAVLMVVLCHLMNMYTDLDATPMGAAGVTVFFSLSGFLITALLLEEAARDGRVSLTGFYLRRARRLLPALVVFLAVVGSLFGVSPAAFGSVLFYAANWASLMGVELGGLDRTWSLAVEEQFYLVWPVALLVSLRWRRGLLWLCALGIVGSCVLRLVLWDGGAGAVRIYRGSDTEAFALLVGCLLSVMLHRGWLRPARGSWPATVSLGAVLATGMLPATDWNSSIVVPLVVPLGAAVAIWAVSGDAPSRWLESLWLRYLGRRSYALYLWHSFAMLMAIAVFGRSWVAVVVGLALSMLIAEASWRLVEAPFLRLKGRGRGAPADDPPASWGRDHVGGGASVAVGLSARGDQGTTFARLTATPVGD